MGLPNEWLGLGLDFGIPFLTLLPALLFLGVIISIQANGAAIAMQRVSWRQDRAVDFREVQGALAGAGATNLMAGIAGAVPNIINPGIAAFTQTTGVASRRVGYFIGGILIVLAFLPKASGLLGSIPGPVMTGSDIPHIRLRVSKEPAILHDGDGSGSTNAVNYPIGLTKPSLGAVN